MKRNSNVVVAVILGVALSFSVAIPAYAADKQDRLDGTVKVINKDASTFTVRQRSNGQERTVVYTGETKFTKAKGRKSEPSTVDEVVKEGQRVIAAGKYNDKTQLAATEVSLREHQ